MAREATKTQILLARLAIGLIVLFSIAGFVWHGFSADVRDRVLGSIVERPGGPMTFRFILQPVMATVLAAIDGWRDARSGAPAYLWGIVFGPGTRADRLYDGVIATSRVILLGLVMDAVYQFMMFDSFYPGEAAIMAVLLAFLPYLLLRGPFSRLARAFGVGPSGAAAATTGRNE
jgi:hypothetical protein